MSGHRPRRDSASDAKELQTLRKENHKQQREISRLTKMLSKVLVSEEESAEDEDDVTPLSDEGVQCPECNNPLTVVNLGIKTLRACKGCGWRKMF